MCDSDATKKEKDCDVVMLLKELYRDLPYILKKKIVIHAAIALLAMILLLVISFCFSDIILMLPCLLLSGLMIVKAAALFYNCIAGNYIEITGICSDVEKTTIRKKVKYVILRAEDKKLRLNIHCNLKNICVGDALTVYISKKAPLYHKDGMYIANEFYGVAVNDD